MCGNNVEGNRETDTCTLSSSHRCIPTPEEGLEDLANIRLGNPDALVDYSDDNAAILARHFESDRFVWL